MPRKLKSPLPQPVFSEPKFNEDGTPTPDPTTFRTAHDKKKDDQLYKQFQNLLTKDTVSFPISTAKPGDLFPLGDALGSQGQADVQTIQNYGKIVFHAIGDSGASILPRLAAELSVADHLVNEIHTATGADRPSFLFHLGDLIYSFGESQYYYDQFYEPFRSYPAPIFAIPGNHDSFIIPGTASADAPLKTFMRNFCAPSPQITKDAGSLHRTAMTQPGVYFALDAPFVRMIGLFSNALEDPGVISSQKGKTTKWPGVPDFQLAFLAAQLKRIKSENYIGAVIIAVHHPPFAYASQSAGGTSTHSSSTQMLREIDTICQTQGVYPHAFISGHAHNYQRFTRKINFGGSNYSVPFIVAGNGGHNVTSLVKLKTSQDPALGAQVGYLDPNPVVNTLGLTIDNFDHTHFGYLRITVDSKLLQIEYHPIGKDMSQLNVDKVIVDLTTHCVV